MKKFIMEGSGKPVYLQTQGFFSGHSAGEKIKYPFKGEGEIAGMDIDGNIFGNFFGVVRKLSPNLIKRI